MRIIFDGYTIFFKNKKILPGVLGVYVPNEVLELSRGLGMVGIKSVLRRLARYSPVSSIKIES